MDYNIVILYHIKMKSLCMHECKLVDDGGGVMICMHERKSNEQRSEHFLIV